MDNVDQTARIKAAYRNALSGPVGGEMLRDLIKQYVLSPNPHKDALMMARFEGRRDLVLAMLSLLHERVDEEAEDVLRTAQPTTQVEESSNDDHS